MSGVISRLDRLLLSAGGLGLVPVAPGTFGSLGTVLAVALPLHLLDVDARITVGACFVFGVLVTLLRGHVVSAPGSKGDPGWVVSDEVAGQALALLPMCIAGSGVAPTWISWAVAFGLFRLFDVLKPGPVRWAERRGGAMGILLDDLVAGLIAAVLLTLGSRLVG